MSEMINSVYLYVNKTKTRAVNLSYKAKVILKALGYEVVDDIKTNPDLIIGFGGDGTLLQLLSQENYNIKSKYMGINCGTVGFLQDFEDENIETILANINEYSKKDIHFVEAEVVYNSKSTRFNSLNELYFSSANDEAFRANVCIDEEFLENFVGTALIFATPSGSTGHNISSVGSILYPNLEVIQMTPSEANISSRSLAKSIVIPKGIITTLKPTRNEKIKILADRQKVYEGPYDCINIYYSNNHLTKLTRANESFVKKIKEKLI